MTVEEFKLPDVGEGVAEGELVTWLVSPGDTVTEDQPVAEVETDKALVEVPSPYNGTVRELLAEEGEMVPVGDVIITFDVDGEEDEHDADEASRPASTEESGDTEPDAATVEADTTGNGAPAETSTRVFAPPSARRLARELQVDISEVDGSGPGGRITEADIRAHAGSGASGSDGEGGPSPRDVDLGTRQSAVSRRDSGTESAEDSSVETADRDRTLAVPATRRIAREADVDINTVPTDKTRDGEPFVTSEQVRDFIERRRQPAEPTVELATETDSDTKEVTSTETVAEEAAGTTTSGETIAYRGVRRTIGQQMEKSKYTAPHVSHHDSVVVDELVELRGALKSRAEERGTRLTYMPFVMKAVSAALREFPILNSELREDEEEIRLKDAHNIGVAVATDAGLMVPVVDNVDQKAILELASEVNDLAGRARERKLSREEMQGGTFTITNFGAIGGEYATPIINYPETAILGLGAIEERPVAEDGEVLARHTLPLSLSIDHRVIDGAEAARFTNQVMEYLSDPRLLMLE